MKRNTKISAAVAAILGAPATTIVIAAPAETSTTAGTGIELQEVVVTATRREENLQNVPIAIQALTGDTLSKLNATTFDDYVKYLPNVTAQGLGPGQNNIYMRGLATGVTGIQGSGVVGSFPNVAIYLDEQSAQVPGRNLDIFAADLERIEVLARLSTTRTAAATSTTCRRPLHALTPTWASITRTRAARCRPTAW